MLKRIKKAVSFNRPVRPKTELSEEDIINGLQCISDKIKERFPTRNENPIQMIVSGGAIAVLILRIRKSTDDVDYYIADPDASSALYDAKYAAAADPRMQGYSHRWINADMVAHILHHAGCETLFDDSVQMNILLFRSDYLHVYVADWRYQLVGKIKMAFERRMSLLIEMASNPDSELAQALSNEVHIIDAVYILNVLIEKANNGQPLLLSVIKLWYYYGALITDEEVAYTNSVYQSIFNRSPGIVKDVVIR